MDVRSSSQAAPRSNHADALQGPHVAAGVELVVARADLGQFEAEGGQLADGAQQRAELPGLRPPA